MAVVWRLTGATMTGRTAVGTAIVEAAARHPLCNELSTEIFIFPTAHRHGPLVLRLFVRASRGMGVIWIAMVMERAVNDFQRRFSRRLGSAGLFFCKSRSNHTPCLSRAYPK